jgi:AraC-like DNA-binding protein
MLGVDLIFLHGENAPRCAAHVDKRFVGYSAVQYMTQGGIDLRYDDRCYELDGPWFWHTHPGPLIQFAPRPPHRHWHHRYIAFTGTLIDRWRAQGLMPDRPQQPEPGADYAARFDRIIEMSDSVNRWQLLRAINMLEAILIELAQAEAQPVHEQPWLTLVFDQLSAPQSQQVDYESLAQQCNVALSTLRRRFREATGKPLHQYALECRIAAARALLHQSDEPIKSIADRLGYRDVYFFSRQFRRFVGLSPGAYRRSRPTTT